MVLRKKPLEIPPNGHPSTPLLLAILSSSLCAVPLPQAAEKVLEGGADLIELREKGSSDRSFLSLAKKIQAICREHNKIFIVNDNVDVALACEVDGIHLGQEDLPLTAARSVLGKDRIIGISTHDLKQALAGQEGGADYIGFGPIFPTQTKHIDTPLGIEALEKVAREIRIPIFPIGGINASNLREIVQAGVPRAAVSSAICCAGDMFGATRELKGILCGNR